MSRKGQEVEPGMIRRVWSPRARVQLEGQTRWSPVGLESWHRARAETEGWTSKALMCLESWLRARAVQGDWAGPTGQADRENG